MLFDSPHLVFASLLFSPHISTTKTTHPATMSHFEGYEANHLGAAADIISTVEFDHTGNYLATGDKGGRVVLFERNETVWTLL